jgi:hypothetical protein
VAPSRPGSDPVPERVLTPILSSLDDLGASASTRNLGAFTDAATQGDLRLATLDDLSSAGGQEGTNPTLLPRDNSPLATLRLTSSPSLFVQYAVRHESLVVDHALFVLNAVQRTHAEARSIELRCNAGLMAEPAVAIQTTSEQTAEDAPQTPARVGAASLSTQLQRQANAFKTRNNALNAPLNARTPAARSGEALR